MSKIPQNKIPMFINENNEMHIDLLNLIAQPPPNWKLVRKHDKLTKHSFDVIWVEFNEDGTFKSKHDEPAIGRSLVMSPFNRFFTWQTTTIIKIVKQKKEHIKFKTQNSTYELWKL